MHVYLAGEIHTDWRDNIVKKCSDLGITFYSPVTDHPASDDCGVKILELRIVSFGMIIKVQN